jgi:hypothetical protein
MSWKDDYIEIKTKFNLFVDSWEKRSADTMNNLIFENAAINFSIFKKVQNRDELKRALVKIGKVPDFSRFTVNNYVCLIENDKAQQISGLSGYYSSGSASNYEHYAFTGMFANSWEKKNNSWKMTTMHFDLLTDDSNTASQSKQDDEICVKGNGRLEFVPDWNPIQDEMIQDGFHKRHLIRCICGDLDAPWLVIKHPLNQASDEERLRELLTRYAFMIDTNTYSLYEDLFTKDASISLAKLGEMTYDTAIRMLKQLSSKAVRIHHMLEIKKINVKENYAQAIAYRRTADEIYPFEYTKDKEPFDFVSGSYDLTFRKDNGNWRISHLSYYPGAFINESYEAPAKSQLQS